MNNNNTKPLDWMSDKRPDKGGFQQGKHVQECRRCNGMYLGGPWSSECADCAYSSKLKRAKQWLLMPSIRSFPNKQGGYETPPRIISALLDWIHFTIYLATPAFLIIAGIIGLIELILR